MIIVQVLYKPFDLLLQVYKLNTIDFSIVRLQNLVFAEGTANIHENVQENVTPIHLPGIKLC